MTEICTRGTRPCRPLTAELADPRGPVARWLRSTFPHHHDMQAGFREAAGHALVLPSSAVSRTQGAAIDSWLRILTNPE